MEFPSKRDIEKIINEDNPKAKADRERVPFNIWVVSLFYPITDYMKEFGREANNEAKGEIEHFNIAGEQNSLPVGRQVCGYRDFVVDGKTVEYSMHWIHLGNDWMKLISKLRQ